LLGSGQFTWLLSASSFSSRPSFTCFKQLLVRDFYGVVLFLAVYGGRSLAENEIEIRPYPALTNAPYSIFLSCFFSSVSFTTDTCPSSSFSTLILAVALLNTSYFRNGLDKLTIPPSKRPFVVVGSESICIILNSNADSLVDSL
jgi:hypothetical protein